MNTDHNLRLAARLLALLALVLLTAGLAVAQNEKEEERRRSQTLDPRVAQDLLEGYELLEAEKYPEALESLNRLINRRGDDMKPFDKASVLQIRGTAHVNVEDMDSALADFRAALDLDALPFDQQNRLRFNMAQIYFVLERYRDSIKLFEEWMAQEGVEITHTTHFMLAAAHYNLEEYREALPPIQRAIDTAPEPEKRYYDLTNVVYSNLGMNAERVGLLETMVQLWPESLSYWRQLSALYLEQGDQMKSFATLEAAYLAGLIEDSGDIILLAQYYSTFDNPHRGAQLIEDEMEAGRIDGNVKNLELLSQLWSQAREHKKAIPVLRQAAQLSDAGELSFRLGQSLLADERNEDAITAFEAALEKGELDPEQRGEAWMLLGNARFNLAGPGDRDRRLAADRAFAEAERFPNTRRQASDWRSYISAINRTESRQAMLEQEQNERLAEAAQERLLTSCRAQQLAGSQLSNRCEEILAEHAAGDG
ncbi:MAG: tetratricopeptide repeat protein [Wenzhouxiangellaceae bacterium]|nr:tetratricopeptide repeat protein [Wenzhouxiangellaceae bacterium]